MRSRRAAAALVIVAVAVLAGAGAWLGVPQVGQDPAGGGAEIARLTEGEIAGLGETLNEGRIVYLKAADYKEKRVGPQGPGQYPQQVVLETWLQVGSDGLISRSMTTMKTVDGELIQYASGNHRIITQTDVKTGDVFEFELAPDTTTLYDWLKMSAARPQRLLNDEDFEYAGRGRLNGLESVIFEDHYGADGHEDGVAFQAPRIRLEFVEADPLLNRETHYTTRIDGTEAIVSWTETVEYKILESGATMPTVP